MKQPSESLEEKVVLNTLTILSRQYKVNSDLQYRLDIYESAINFIHLAYGEEDQRKKYTNKFSELVGITK